MLPEALTHERGREVLFGIGIELESRFGIGRVGLHGGSILAKEGSVLGVDRRGITTASLFTTVSVFGDVGNGVRSAVYEGPGNGGSAGFDRGQSLHVFIVFGIEPFIGKDPQVGSEILDPLRVFLERARIER